MNVLHLQITEPQKGNWQLKSWASDPLQAPERPIAVQAIQKLTASASTEYYMQAPRPDIGQELFRLLDGPERLLTNAIRDAEQSAEPLVLAIDARADLAFLPWEIMADERGFLVERQNPRIVPARWDSGVGKSAKWPAPKRRPLRALFMAAAPTNGGQPLDYDAEEGRMTSLRSLMGDQLLHLTVEETGCLPDLRSLVDYHDENTFDVFHLTGHAGFTDDKKPIPVFDLENEVGERVAATASDLLSALPHRPQLVFLSGCHTARPVMEGAEHSLAGSMVRGGIPAVLGWGLKVGDTGAAKAAEILYRELAHGHSVPSALSLTWRELIRTGETDWHHLRLHFAGAVPGRLVTAPSTWDATAAVPPRSSDRFLVPGELRTKVPGPMEFVGRRRQLQECLRILRSPDQAGVLLHGTGGLGKSSITARLADRLGDTYRMAAVFGEATEDRLLNALKELLPKEAEAALFAGGDLRSRLCEAISTCPHRILFVLDDYERNQANPADSTDIGQVGPEAAPVLQALAEAVGASRGRARLIISSRYIPPAALIPRVIVKTLAPITAADEEKRIARLLATRPAEARPPEALLQHARRAAGGNHRLLEWLFEAMADSSVIDAALLTRLEAVDEKFRNDLLARELCAALPPAAHALLTALQVCEIPVPLAALAALPVPKAHPAGISEEALANYRATELASAVAWGLAYVFEIDDQPHWLAAPFLRPILGDPPAGAAPAVLAVLQKLWWDDSETWTEPRLLELHRLAIAAGDHHLACDHTHRLCAFWLNKNRSREAAALAARTLEAIAPQRDPRLLTALARALRVLGDGPASAALFAEAAALHGDMDDQKGHTLFNHAGLLFQQGKLDEAEAIYRDQLLPFFTAKGDTGLRERAIILGKIAEILSARGQLDEALQNLLEEQLPVFEILDDVRSRAVTQGKIANILRARGRINEAMRIRREEELPVYEKLGDEHSRAVTLGHIADILSDRGQFDEALRIRREEELPVYEKLGDVYSRAVTLGHIADILSARGQLDEALRIHREEELPVYEKLGDLRSRAVIARKIADILEARGGLEEAERMLREEALEPIRGKGMVRDEAVFLGRIADILSARGQLDEALRILREEQLPVYEKLGDVRGMATTHGKIAHIMMEQGNFDGALSVRLEHVLPAFNHLGETRLILVERTMIAQMLAMRGNEEDVMEIVTHLAWAWREAKRMGLPEAGQIEELAGMIGLPMEMLAQVAEQL